MTKIQRDHGQSLQTAYEYTYTGDGIRHMKKDHLTTKEYRYGCSIDCGGMPLRVYSRDLGSQGEWSNVEDYLQVGTALGYGPNWQFAHSGGELLMMGASGEPKEYYPQDSNGLGVQSEPSAPCVCAVQPQTPAVCPPLGYGGCEGGRCGEAPSVLPPGVPGLPEGGMRPSPILPDYSMHQGGGGPRFINCTLQQEQLLRRHLQDVCNIRIGLIPSQRLRPCLQRRCNNIVITCAAANDPMCTGACGYTPLPWPRQGIVVCPNGFNRALCGCLGRTILHEMVHSCNEQHPLPYACEWYAYGPGRPPCPN